MHITSFMPKDSLVEQKSMGGEGERKMERMVAERYVGWWQKGT